MRILLLSVAVVLASGCVTTSGAAKEAPVEHAAVPVTASPDVPVAPEAAPASPRVGKDVEAREAVERALAALPRCEAGRDAKGVAVSATVCTKMFCDEPCCNRCGWRAIATGMDGASADVTQALRAALGLPDGGLDCEVKAWREALATRSLALDPPACVVK